jgi:hypothetical protein
MYGVFTILALRLHPTRHFDISISPSDCCFRSNTTTQPMFLDKPDQPTTPAVQAATTIPPNSPEVSDPSALPLASITDNDEKELDQARQAMTWISTDHPDWLHRSRALASLLMKSFEKTSRGTVLDECIDIQRRICVVCTIGNPDRARSVSDLALSLWTHFNQEGEESLLVEAIGLNRFI